MIPYFNIPFEQYPRNSMNAPPPMGNVGGHMPPQMPSYIPSSVPMPSIPPPEEPQAFPEPQPLPEMPYQAAPAFPANCPMMQMYQQQMVMPVPSAPMMYEDMDVEGDMMESAPRPGQIGDPPPVLSNNPATASITLFKELSGFPNYGNPSGNADILYTGNRGSWTFDLPQGLLAPGNLRRGQIVIRAVLDDHYNIAVNRYSARITINGTVVHNGPVPLEHGTPSGGMFNNWRNLTFNVANIRRSNRIQIENTSRAGVDDWIGLDWMEMRFTSR